MAAIVAGIAAVAISCTALYGRQLHTLAWLVMPAGFAALQFLITQRLMAAVSLRTRQRVLPGPGMMLSGGGAGLLGYVAYHEGQPVAKHPAQSRARAAGCEHVGDCATMSAPPDAGC